MVQHDAPGGTPDRCHGTGFKRRSGSSNNYNVISSCKAINKGNPALGSVPEASVIGLIIILFDKLACVAREDSELGVIV